MEGTLEEALELRRWARTHQGRIFRRPCGVLPWHGSKNIRRPVTSLSACVGKGRSFAARSRPRKKRKRSNPASLRRERRAARTRGSPHLSAFGRQAQRSAGARPNTNAGGADFAGDRRSIPGNARRRHRRSQFVGHHPNAPQPLLTSTAALCPAM